MNDKEELYIRPRQTTEEKIPVMPGGFSHTGSDTASLKHPVPGAHIPFSFPSFCQETPIQPLLLLPQTCISTARPKIKNHLKFQFPRFPLE